jgi:DNA-binding MarR family transcriptional regulator
MARSSKTGYQAPLTTSRAALLANGSDDKFRSTVDSLVSFATQLQQVREAIARRMDLAPPQYNILMILAHRGGCGMTVSEMAQRMRVSVPFIVMETRRLGEMGFLIKETDEKDRRRVNLVLADKGKVAVARIAPLQREVNDVLFASLGRKDFDDLIRLTNGLLGSCESALSAARTFPQRSRKASPEE